MVEADELCDRVAIIDKGRILACDSPRNLKRTISKSSTFSIETTPFGDANGLAAVKGVTGFSVETTSERTVLKLVTEDESAIADIISYLTQHSAKVISLHKNEPTLEDVFIQMVGRGLNDRLAAERKGDHRTGLSHGSWGSCGNLPGSFSTSSCRCSASPPTYSTTGP